MRRAQSYFNKEFSPQEEAERLERHREIERRRKWERVYLVRLSAPPQLIDESVGFGTRFRTPDELKWAEDRLSELKFSVVNDGNTRKYEFDSGQFIVLADPREFGRITFRVYRKSAPKPRKRSGPRFDDMYSFHLMDTWRNDLEGKFRKRLEQTQDRMAE